jgi:MFS family permease
MTGGATTTKGRTHAGYAAFTYRDFRLHFAFRLFSGVAMQIQTVGVGWYLYTETKSAWALGFAGLASFLPSVALALFTGHVADNYNRRIVVGLAFFTCCISALGLALIVTFAPGATWPLYLCLILTGAGRAFGNPAANAITPSLVPREHFANAISWFSLASQTAMVSGPAIGGLLYVFGPTAVFGVASAGFFASSFFEFSIRTPMGRGERPREPVSWETLGAGLRFIWSRPELFGAISLDLAAVLFGGAAALLPIVAQDILHTDPFGLGLLRSAPAVGAIMMAVTLAYFPLQSKVGRKLLWAVTIYGLSTIAFGLSNLMLLSLGMLAIMGAANAVSVVIRHTMVQIETPDEMRGRVAAVNSIFTGTSTDLGDFEAGATAAMFGTAPAIVIGGVATIFCAGLWGWMFPALRERDKLVRTLD